MNRPPLSVLAGLLLGLTSLFFGAVTGLPAVVLSFVGLRAVNLSDGKLSGARLAVAGLVMGSVGTLLTVAGFIAMAVMRLEETANRAGCMNHQRLIGIALNEYAVSHNSFPAATRDPANLPPERRLSWMTRIVADLHMGSKANEAYRRLEKRIDRSAAWDDPANAAALAVPVRPFMCPGHPQYRPHASPGLTHYVGLSGIGEGAAALPREDAKAGVFGHDRGIAPHEAEAGNSNTLAVMETTVDNGPWMAGGRPTVRGVPEGDGLIGPGRPFGGMHRGLTFGLMLDGSSREMNNGMKSDLVRQLVRLRGR